MFIFNKQLFRISSTNYTDGSRKLHVDEYSIKKETKCGYRLTDGKFVYKNCKNSFAFDTEEKAWINFKYRRSRYIGILKGKLKDAESDLDIAIEEVSNPNVSDYIKSERRIKFLRSVVFMGE